MAAINYEIENLKETSAKPLKQYEPNLVEIHLGIITDKYIIFMPFSHFGQLPWQPKGPVDLKLEMVE